MFASAPCAQALLRSSSGKGPDSFASPLSQLPVACRCAGCDRRRAPRLIARLTWVWLLLIWLTLAPGTSLLRAQQFPETNVLVLYSHEREMAAYKGLDEGLRAVMESSSTHRVEFYTEYLDLMRFPDEANQQRLLDYLSVKYSGRKIDLIFAISPLALNFLTERGTKLFPDTPIVFTSVNVQNLHTVHMQPNITGVAVKRDIRDTLDVALGVQPDTRRVVVVGGASAIEKSWMTGIQKLLQPYENRVAITYVAGLSMDEVLNQLKSLPRHTVVLFSSAFFYDGAGRYFLPEEALDLICRYANAPVYAINRSYLGSGIVGGNLYNMKEAGTAAGRIGERILAGQAPNTIPIQTLDANHNEFDARQLGRWGISVNSLPPGSTVLFAPPSFWQLYKQYVLACLAVFAIQLWLLVALIVQARKRKNAQIALIAKQVQLSEAQRLAEVGSWQWDLKSRHLQWSDELYRIAGLNRELSPPTGEDRARLYGEDSWERLQRAERDLLREGIPYQLELQTVRSDGTGRWIFARGEAKRDASGQIVELRGTVQDITERKEVEKALRESEERFRLMADSAPVMMWVSGPSKVYSSFNQEWLNFTGRSLEQELGYGWSLGVYPGDLAGCLNTYFLAFDSKQKFSMEFRLRRYDGQYRWLLNAGAPRFLVDGTLAGYIGCCVDITDQKEAIAERAGLSGRLIRAQEEERSRIARELHDDINQRMALLAIELQQLDRALPSSRQQIMSSVQNLFKQTQEISADIQHLSHRLHSSKLQHLGLAAALRGLCREFSKQQKIEVECAVQDLPRHLREDVALCLFRVAQEALHNVGKHSRARKVRVELAAEAEQVRLKVSDDGIGFDLHAEKSRVGLGLVSMSERMRLAGGELSTLSRATLGTQIAATAPFAYEAPEASLIEPEETSAKIA